MKVFEGVDIEFLDFKTEKPEDGEKITVILKDSISMRAPSYLSTSIGAGNSPTGIPAITTAVYKEYKTRPCKFVDSTGYYTLTYRLDEIICWARIRKINGNN